MARLAVKVVSHVVACAALLGARNAAACDLCSIYTGTVMQAHRTGPWVAVSEQFTSFNTLRDGDHQIANDAGEWLQSLVTQFVLGYGIHPRFGMQLNVPVISREFRRFHDGAIDRDDEAGLGDVSVVGRLSAYEHVTGRSVLRLDLLAGLKFPTGDSDRLGEELAEAEPPPPAGALRAAAEPRPHHEGQHDELSGVHGHDLALGSGSVDGIFGLAMFSSWRRAFFEGSLQYLVRGNGDFHYTFADDLQWSGGPGAFLWLGHHGTAALQAQLSGETKGKDHQAGERLDDTAVTALYLGPQLSGTFQDALHADIGVEWPVFQHVTDVQIVADWRLRAGLTWRF